MVSKTNLVRTRSMSTSLRERFLQYPELEKCLALTNSSKPVFDLNSPLDIPFITSIFWRSIHLDFQDLSLLCICHICDVCLKTDQTIDLQKLLTNLNSYTKFDSFLTLTFELKILLYNFIKNNTSPKACYRKLENLSMRLNSYLSRRKKWKNFLNLLKSYFLFLDGNIITQKKNENFKILFSNLFPNKHSEFDNNKEQVIKLIELETPEDFIDYWKFLVNIFQENLFQSQIKNLSNFYETISLKKLAELTEIEEKAIKKKINEIEEMKICENKKFARLIKKEKNNLEDLCEDLNTSYNEFNKMLEEIKDNKGKDKNADVEESFVYQDEELDLDELDKYDDFFSDSEGSF